MNKEVNIDELNKVIIENINDSLQKFCFGEYKEEEIYPIVLTKTKTITSAQVNEFKISYRLHKNKIGMLRHLMIVIEKLKL